MLKKFYLFALLTTLGMGPLNAAAAANFDPSNGQWRVIGEYLYWQPSVDDTYFVIDSPVTTTFPNGKKRNNDFNFHSGYRVGGAFLFCDCEREVQITYTNLNFTQNKEIAGDFLWATVGRADLVSSFENYAGTADSGLKFTYQNVDAFYAQQLYDCCGLDFGVQIGLEAVELKLHETYAYTSDASTALIHQHCKTNAIGPKIGFAIGYEIYKGDSCGCPGTLSLNVLTSGSLLAADTKTTVDNVLGGETILDVSDKKSWRVVPALHARAGLNYDMEFSCVDASLEIGYEFTSFLRGLSRQSYPDDVADGLTFNNYYNFDMQGLYVSGSVTF